MKPGFMAAFLLLKIAAYFRLSATATATVAPTFEDTHEAIVDKEPWESERKAW